MKHVLDPRSRPLAALLFGSMLAAGYTLLLCAYGCGGGGGSGSGSGGGTAPLAAEGAYEGSGSHGEDLWFLVGDGGKGVMNFALDYPPDIDIDLVKDPNEVLDAMEEESGFAVFTFTVEQPTLVATVKGVYHEDGHYFEVGYNADVKGGGPHYTNIVKCVLTTSEVGLGQQQENYTFRDISVNTGLVNILKDGYTLSFADFDGVKGVDLFVSDTPSLYRFMWGALNGLGYYMVDCTFTKKGHSKYGNPTEGEPFGFWADLDDNGRCDLVSGGRIYLNVTQTGDAPKFEDEDGYQISETDPPFMEVVDFDGDNDLDLFTGIWHTNLQDEDLDPPLYELSFEKNQYVVYPYEKDAVACAFAPIDFDASDDPAEIDVDLDLVEVVDVLGNKVLKVYRCDRDVPSQGTTTFTEVPDVFPGAFTDVSSLAFGDVDNDRKLDLLVADTANGIHLYRNTTDVSGAPPYTLAFTDVTNAVFGTSPPAGDVEFADYDNDGWLDFCIAAPAGMFSHMLFRNTTGETGGVLSFKEVTWKIKSAPYLQESGAHPRCTWCDIDGNGAPDIALGLHRLFLLKNAGGGNHYVRIEPKTDLEGGHNLSKRIALGAVVLVDWDRDGNFDAVRYADAGRRTHLWTLFGLGASATAVDVRVYFQDGTVVDSKAEFPDGLAVDQAWSIYDVQ